METLVKSEFKQRIVAQIIQIQRNYKSAAKLAVALGINAAQLSRIKKGEFHSVISDANWLSIANRLSVQAKESEKWITAQTSVYNFIYQQLTVCQAKSLSAIFCDDADIGKTHTGKDYVLRNKNSVYVDCSRVKSKQKLVRKIAKEFGVNHTGKYETVFEELCFYLNNTPQPLVILDEAGDLDYSAFLELKALWNATEGTCGWYMMGAEGLAEKIDANKGRKKVGFAEIFSRYGSKYQKSTPKGGDELTDFKKELVFLVAKANNPQADIQKLYAKTSGSLRRVKIELGKRT